MNSEYSGLDGLAYHLDGGLSLKLLLQPFPVPFDGRKAKDHYLSDLGTCLPFSDKGKDPCLLLVQNDSFRRITQVL